ncbi:hypothetical protein Gotur_018623 [Gossypium turneri]
MPFRLWILEQPVALHVLLQLNLRDESLLLSQKLLYSYDHLFLEAFRSFFSKLGPLLKAIAGLAQMDSIVVVQPHQPPVAHVISMANNEIPATKKEILETTLYEVAIAHDFDLGINAIVKRKELIIEDEEFGLGFHLRIGFEGFKNGWRKVFKFLKIGQRLQPTNVQVAAMWGVVATIDALWLIQLARLLACMLNLHLFIPSPDLL